MDKLIKIILVVLVAFMLLNYSCSFSKKELFTKKKKKITKKKCKQLGRKWKKKKCTKKCLKGKKGKKCRKKKTKQVSTETTAAPTETTAVLTETTAAPTTDPEVYVQGPDYEKIEEEPLSCVKGEKDSSQFTKLDCSCEDSWNYKGVKYNGCSKAPDNNGLSWCKTKSNRCGENQNNSWKNCAIGEEMKYTPCDKQLCKVNKGVVYNKTSGEIKYVNGDSLCSPLNYRISKADGPSNGDYKCYYQNINFKDDISKINKNLDISSKGCPINDNVVSKGCTKKYPYLQKYGEYKFCTNHKACSESIDCLMKMKDLGISCKMLSLIHI